MSESPFPSGKMAHEDWLRHIGKSPREKYRTVKLIIGLLVVSLLGYVSIAQSPKSTHTQKVHNQINHSSSNLSVGWYRTKKGFPVASTKEMLKHATSIIASKDFSALAKLVANEQIGMTVEGMEVFLEESTGIFGPIRIRPKGSINSAWVDYDAIY